MRRPRLSGLQFAMLETIATGVYMTVEDAQLFDQRPFRSMLIQQWCAYRPGRGFHITPEGKRARDEFLHTDIARKNPLLPLTAYFDPTAYGLKVPSKKASVHVMAKRDHAA
jgi:hypothetical protein